jgi:CxxC-x17-CxxC domain-containing protein
MREKNFGRTNFKRSGRRHSDRSSNRDSDNFRRTSGRSTRGSDRNRPVTMHEAICDKCGKKCEVPFKPTEGKPVHCSDCFRNLEKPENKNFHQINVKLDKIMKALKIKY